MTIDGAAFVCRPFEGPKIPGKDRLYVPQSLLPLRIAFATAENRALRMETLGMEGRSKKISRILKDAHIPQNARNGVLIFFDCLGRPLWIPDCAIGAQVKESGERLWAVEQKEP